MSYCECDDEYTVVEGGDASGIFIGFIIGFIIAYFIFHKKEKTLEIDLFKLASQEYFPLFGGEDVFYTYIQTPVMISGTELKDLEHPLAVRIVLLNRDWIIGKVENFRVINWGNVLDYDLFQTKSDPPTYYNTITIAFSKKKTEKVNGIEFVNLIVLFINKTTGEVIAGKTTRIQLVLTTYHH